MHKSRLALAALALLVLPAAALHAAARTVEITWDAGSKILVEDCNYNVISKYAVTGRLQITKTIYSSKPIRIIYIPLAPDSSTIKKHFKTFKVCAKIKYDNSPERTQAEQRFLFLGVYNGASIGGMVVPVAAPLPMAYPLAYVKLSSGQGCIVVDASKLPSGKKLAAAITWDIPCGEEDLLPTKVGFTVWLEDNRVEVPDDPAPAKPTDTITVMTPKAELGPDSEEAKYAIAGIFVAAAAAALAMAMGRR